MPGRSGDTTEVVLALLPDAGEGAAINPIILRRAYHHGHRARGQFPGTPFDAVEAELRAGWLLNGETARWGDVSGSVRLGFEDDRADR